MVKTNPTFPTPTVTAEVVDGSLRRKVAEARAFFAEQRQRVLDEAVRAVLVRDFPADAVAQRGSSAPRGSWRKLDRRALAKALVMCIRAEFARLMAEGGREGDPDDREAGRGILRGQQGNASMARRASYVAALPSADRSRGPHCDDGARRGR